MSWNYRILRHRQYVTQGMASEWFGLHEVHYREDGKPMQWKKEPEVIASSVSELEETLEMMLSDLRKSRDAVLEESDEKLREVFR